MCTASLKYECFFPCKINMNGPYEVDTAIAILINTFSVHVLHLVDININAQTHTLQCIFY